MDNVCSICFEDMDMNSYQDDRSSTETCFKLECSHAFHTKCIIECLQRTKHKCPNCNESKTFVDELTKEGVVMEIMDELKKIESVNLAMDEYRASKAELTESIRVFKKNVLEYANKVKDEMSLSKKYKYYKQCQSKVLQEAGKHAKIKGGKYRAVFNMDRNNRWFQKALFGVYLRYYEIHFKHPRIHVSI